MGSILSVIAALPDLKGPASRCPDSVHAASAVCRTFAPDSVYDASYDDGAFAAALADAAIAVTRFPEAGDGPFAMATALGVPAASENALAALARELAPRADVVLITLDFSAAGAATARATAAWLAKFAETGLHLDPLTWDETTFPGGMVLRRDAAPLTPRLARAFARILVERNAAGIEHAALAESHAAQEREAARAARLDAENRALRARLDVEERDNRSLHKALRDVNALLSDELVAVQSAQTTVEEDIAALHQSGLWKLKLKLTRASGRGRAT